MSAVTVATGDLLASTTTTIVNPWNTNRWGRLLWPAGVSGALKRVTGPEPWRELRAMGPLRLGAAVVTSGGTSRWAYLIHVAGIDWRWHTTLDVVAAATTAAIDLAALQGARSIAMPMIGAGSGGLDDDAVYAVMDAAAAVNAAPIRVDLVRWKE